MPRRCVVGEGMLDERRLGCPLHFNACSSLTGSLFDSPGLKLKQDDGRLACPTVRQAAAGSANLDRIAEHVRHLAQRVNETQGDDTEVNLSGRIVNSTADNRTAALLSVSESAEETKLIQICNLSQLSPEQVKSALAQLGEWQRLQELAALEPGALKVILKDICERQDGGAMEVGNLLSEGEIRAMPRADAYRSLCQGKSWVAGHETCMRRTMLIFCLSVHSVFF